MPARAMTYKFLNTFIDDLFAWTIKMPTLHRLATLRDDIIFFVYLYQSWAYRIDYTRVNEFGMGGMDEDVAPDRLNPIKGTEGGEKIGSNIEAKKEKVKGLEMSTSNKAEGLKKRE